MLKKIISQKNFGTKSRYFYSKQEGIFNFVLLRAILRIVPDNHVHVKY